MRKESLWWALHGLDGGCWRRTAASPQHVPTGPASANAAERFRHTIGNDRRQRSDFAEHEVAAAGPRSLRLDRPRLRRRRKTSVAAKDQYDRALQIDPAYFPALLGYAHLLDTEKEFAEADKYYQTPRRSILKWQRSITIGACRSSAVEVGRIGEAVDESHAVQPEKQLYRNNLAMVLVVMHKPEEAYRQLVAIEAPAVAHFNLAACCTARATTDGGVSLSHRRRKPIRPGRKPGNGPIGWAEWMIRPRKCIRGLARRVPPPDATPIRPRGRI